MTGFVNALAILIFMAQLPELIGVTWLTYVMVAGGLGIIYLFPYVTKAIPSPLVCIIVLTTLAAGGLRAHVRTVGDLGELPSTLPVFLLPDVPLDLETLLIILPYSAGARCRWACLESLMTAQIVDDLTDTPSDKSRNASARAPPTSPRLHRRHGRLRHDRPVGHQCQIRRPRAPLHLRRRRLPALPDRRPRRSGRIIPMPALVAVMIMVSIGTFSWARSSNLRDPCAVLGRHAGDRRRVVLTHDLAIGVMSACSCPASSSPGRSPSSSASPRCRRRRHDAHLPCRGAALLRLGRDFTAAFDFKEALEKVVIDVSKAHIWDISSVSALDMAVLKFRREGAEVELIGMNEASSTIVDRLAIHDKPGALERLMGH
jgi:sulfate permease, SulP family